MDKDIKEIVETSMDMPISEEGAKTMLRNFHRMVLKQEPDEEKLKALASTLTRTNCERIIDNEENN